MHQLRTVEVEFVTPVSDDGNGTLQVMQPYRAQVTLDGTSRLLFHRWSDDAVELKAKAAKASRAKRTDDVETYVYRNAEGHICIPGTYLLGAICDARNGAAKYLPDPRSPRKSALDLYRAGIVIETELAPIQSAHGNGPAETWDLLDRRRVMVQRQGITRVRPAFEPGWRASFVLQVVTPEYIPVEDLRLVLVRAGQLTGIGDFRPTYGRFVASVELL